nr:MAG TPA: hypothetical protein [Caudoviricetes sp.]
MTAFNAYLSLKNKKPAIPTKVEITDFSYILDFQSFLLKLKS